MNAGLMKRIAVSLCSVAFICGMLGPGLVPLENVYADTIVVSIDAKHFPDKNFRKAILKWYDPNGDGKLSSSEIKKTNEMDVSDCGISDLKGIEYFTSLTLLNCEMNEISKINVSKNTKLETLQCMDNKITSLDLSKNTELEYLSCFENRLTKLDLSKNSKISSIQCNCNKLTTLDLNKKAPLSDLWCSENQLSKLDVSGFEKLEEFGCDYNKLTSLNLSGCSALKSFSCNDNKLTKLDLSGLMNLTYLECSNNKLSGLEISENRTLEQLDCALNNITNLDISSCPYLVEAVNKDKDPTPDKYWSEIHDKNKFKVYQTGIEGDGYFLAVPKQTKVVKEHKKSVLGLYKENEASVVCGSKLMLEPDGYSANAFKWKSSNTDLATVDSNGVVTAKQAGSVVITGVFYDVKVTLNLQVQYKDVTKKSVFWYTPTYYLTDFNVVKGYDKQTSFKPANMCTRAQMVTFIWRLKNCPEPKTKICKFKDVKKTDYFYKACIWGNEQGIVEGYKDGTFGPQIVCARRHAVTFLWRLAKQPEPKTKTNKFKDVKKNDYFYKATL